MLTVFRTEIKIGHQITFAYTANEVSLSGNPINYLSGYQLAELIGLAQTTTVRNRIPQELKVLMGDAFTVMPGQYKMDSGGITKVSLWDTQNATKYWMYHAFRGNSLAQSILLALSSTSLDIIINDAFDRDYEKGKAQQQVNARLEGIDYRVSFTAAIKTFLEENPSEDKLLYPICTDVIYRGLFNRRAANLKADWNTKSPRDSMTAKELFLLAEVEDFAARLIKLDNLHPIKAVKQALNVLRIPVCDR
jgi:hypothetical protein